MKANEKKKLSRLNEARSPTGFYRAGFRINAVMPGVARDWVTSR